MFPHRTAFFDKREKRLIGPEEAGDYEFTMKRHGLEETGKGLLIGSRGQIYTRIKVSESHYDGMDNVSERFEDVASTGLEDSQGNEVFEGDLLKIGGGESIWTCLFRNGQFLLSNGKSSVPINKAIDRDAKTGHALTDPALVPDGFDVEEYFGMEEDDVN